MSKEKIQQEGYATLYSYMTRNKNGAVAKLVFSVPKPYQVQPRALPQTHVCRFHHRFSGPAMRASTHVPSLLAALCYILCLAPAEDNYHCFLRSRWCIWDSTLAWPLRRCAQPSSGFIYTGRTRPSLLWCSCGRPTTAQPTTSTYLQTGARRHVLTVTVCVCANQHRGLQQHVCLLAQR